MFSHVNSTLLITVLVLSSSVRSLPHVDITHGDRSPSGPERRDEDEAEPELLAPNAPEPDNDEEYNIVSESSSSYFSDSDVDDDGDGGGGGGSDEHDNSKRSSVTYDYVEVLHKSILFYEAQRSGKLPANNRIPWRGDSALDDGKDDGVDLTGGWYDTGDCMKFNLPMAYSVTILGWGLIDFWEVYEDAGELENMLDTIRWPCEYLIKCHPNKNVYYYAVGDVKLDHQSWERPENMNMNRPSWKCSGDTPCADVAAEAAAALTTCAIAFDRESDFKDGQFSELCLNTAKSLYTFAQEHKGKYPAVVDNNGQEYYRSNRYHDELAWASLWLYMATGSEGYIFHAKNSIGKFDGENEYIDSAEKMFKRKKYALKAVSASLSWNDKRPGVQLLLYRFTKDKKCKSKITAYIKKWTEEIPRISTGLSVHPNLEWGTNRVAANSAFVAMMACHYKLTYACRIGLEWARSQIHHILGDSGHSYVIGFGENPPTHAHHRGSSCPVDGKCGWSCFRRQDPNPNELTGGMVGGPNSNGKWKDDRRDYVRNEVATDYNAAFQSAVAALKYMEMNKDNEDFKKPSKKKKKKKQ